MVLSTRSYTPDRMDMAVGRVIRADLEHRLNERLIELAQTHHKFVPGGQLFDGIIDVLKGFDWSHCRTATPAALDGLRGEIAKLFEPGLHNSWVGELCFLEEPRQAYRIVEVLTKHGYIPTRWRPVIGAPMIPGDFQTDRQLIESCTPITLRYFAEDGREETVTITLKYCRDGGGRVGQTSDGIRVSYDLTRSGRFEGGYEGWYLMFERSQ